jgi:hypothetical protein
VQFFAKQKSWLTITLSIREMGVTILFKLLETTRNLSFLRHLVKTEKAVGESRLQ